MILYLDDKISQFNLNFTLFYPDCKPDPCHGHGSCHSSAKGFSCSCQQGYIGLSCEQGESKYFF